MSRLQQLLTFLAEDPRDPFNIYAVALEFQKTDPAKAMEFFEILLKDHPDYIPAYYHTGKLLQELNQVPRAILVYQEGIRRSGEQHDHKALRELRNALMEAELE